MTSELPLLLNLSTWFAFHAESALPSSVIQRVERFAPEEWNTLLCRANEHRLHLMLWATLQKEQLIRLVPTEAHDEMLEEVARALNAEKLLSACHQQIASTLHQADVAITACKGIRLATDYYPARGLRRMQDIDYWIEERDTALVLEKLRMLGFQERPEKASPSARNLVNSWGVTLDVHTRMNVFASRGFPLQTITEPSIDGSYRVFSPEAFVAHLVVHMLGHAEATGILLCWVTDLALVLRRHGQALDWERLQSLLPENGSWEVLLRFVRSFEEAGWFTLDGNGSLALGKARPIPWSLFIRQIRMRPWLNPKGLARLARHGVRERLGMNAKAHRPMPSSRELLQAPSDWLREGTRALNGSSALFLLRDPR